MFHKFYFKLIAFVFVIILISSCRTSKHSKENGEPLIDRLEEITPVTATPLHDLPEIEIDTTFDKIYDLEESGFEFLGIKVERIEEGEKAELTIYEEDATEHKKLTIRIPFNINSSSDIYANYFFDNGEIGGIAFSTPVLSIGLKEYGEKCECRSTLYFIFEFTSKTFKLPDYEIQIWLNNEQIEL